MTTGIVISIAVTVILLIISLIFRIAGKLHLTWPLLYLIVAGVSTLFSPWVTEHETLVFVGFYILLGFSIFAWIRSIVRFLKKRAKKRKERREAK